ncbi:MAG: LemA family protein [Synergistaceae bacterium]|nr:LemA family protein [Synergistaceae bacterium]
MALAGLAVVVCLGVLIFWCMFTYNSFREKQTRIDFWWDEVDAYLQLRRDLIPSLLDRVRPIMGAQSAILDRIAGIREEIVRDEIKANSLVIEPEMEKLENRLSSEMHSLKDAFRQHKEAQMNPDLLTVMSELESIEGKAVIACQEYNKLTGDFNSSLKRLPANLIAGLLHFNPLERRIFGGVNE